MFFAVLIVLLLYAQTGCARSPAAEMPVTNVNNSDFRDDSPHWVPGSSPICENMSSQQEYFRVCSMESAPGDYGNIREHHRVLVFRWKSKHVKLFIGMHHVNLPNATVSMTSAKEQSVPVYHESISRHLFTYYAGSLVISDIHLPFTAHFDGVIFSGAAIHNVDHFQLQCSSISSTDFYETNGCFQCAVSCSKLTLADDDNESTVQNVTKVPSHGNRVNNSHSTTRNKRYLYDNFVQQKSCVLHIVADHLFHTYVGSKSISKTLNTMLNIINDADAIFRSVDFDGDGFGDNIGFLVGKVDIYSLGDRNYKPPKAEYMSPDEYLSWFSTAYDFSQFCLGLAFTYRDLGGIVGVSYAAYSDPYIPGGICQQQVVENFRNVSYNVLAVSMYDFRRRLTHENIVLNLVHELGHSFGARHDEEAKDCSSQNFGKFIMNSHTNPGTEPNNRKFSRCSLVNMVPVIMKKGYCLVNDNLTSYCGNTIPEGSEECDCGRTKICMIVDPCCTPSDHIGGPDRPCTFRRSKGKMCSPRKSLCCTENCTFVPQSQRQVCSALDGCSLTTVCDGQSGHCPFSIPQQDGTPCNNNLDVCKSGSCSVGACEYHNMSTCYCKKPMDQCKLCCREKHNNLCKPFENFKLTSPEKVILLDPGVPCFKHGYCDHSHLCIEYLIAEIPIFGPESEKYLKSHFYNYWFYYFLTGLCFLILLTFLTISYKTNDDDYLKALRYGKMLAIFSQGEYQSQIYRKMLIDIHNYYNVRMYKIHNLSEPLQYFEAVARLKVLFPQAPTQQISHIVKISASESMAVKLLLIKGFQMRTFTERSLSPM